MLSIDAYPNHPWTQMFDQESERLVAILGKITEGGIVEAIEHIGSTSVLGLSGAPCVDIGLSVWPFPLEPAPPPSPIMRGSSAWFEDHRRIRFPRQANVRRREVVKS